MSSCIFCKICSGESPCHKVWENENHLAFLSIFPNTKGFTVVIPKIHLTSYVFDQDMSEITELMLASKQVSKLLTQKLPDVARVGVVFEGYGVDHLHAKLIPLHGTKSEKWKAIRSKCTEKLQSYSVYQGYMSTHDADRANDEELAELAKKIRL